MQNKGKQKPINDIMESCQYCNITEILINVFRKFKLKPQERFADENEMILAACVHEVYTAAKAISRYRLIARTFSPLWASPYKDRCSQNGISGSVSISSSP